MKVKFGGKIYKVLDARELPGGVMSYAVEDEPGHVDWLVNVEVI